MKSQLLGCCCLYFAQLCPVFPLLPLRRLPRPNCMTAPAEKDLQLSCCPTGDSSLAADQLQLNPGLVAAGMLLVRSQPDHFEATRAKVDQTQPHFRRSPILIPET